MNKKYDFEVFSVPALATEHITSSDLELLYEEGQPSHTLNASGTGMLIDCYDGGAWVKFANGDVDDEHIMNLIAKKYSGHFTRLIERLKEMGFNRVRFDVDTPTSIEFPVFN